MTTRTKKTPTNAKPATETETTSSPKTKKQLRDEEMDVKLLTMVKNNPDCFISHSSTWLRAMDLCRRKLLEHRLCVYSMRCGELSVEEYTSFTITDAGLVHLASLPVTTSNTP